MSQELRSYTPYFVLRYLEMMRQKREAAPTQESPHDRTYCTCEQPVMDVEHDAGCRRCGLPVDFSPKGPTA